MSNGNSVTAYEIEIQQYRNETGRVVRVLGGMPEELRMENTSTWEAPFSQGLLGMLPGSISTALKMFGVRPATQMMTLQVWQGTEGSDLTFDLVFTTDSDPVKDVMTPVLDLLSMVVPSLDTNGFMITPGPTLDPAEARRILDEVLKTGKDVVSKGWDIVKMGFNMGADVGRSINTDGTLSDQQNKSTTPTITQKTASREEAVAKRNEMAKCIKNRISIRLGKFLNIRDVVVIAASPVWGMTYLDGETGIPNICTVSVVVRPLFAVTMQDLQDMFQVTASASAPRTGYYANR